MAEATNLINLKILSPSTEVEGGVNFPNLPASTTIKELRQRIHDAVPTKPALDRMRLIYRGRVVANENDTLVDVFGLDNIRDSKDQSLHLVLRELHSASSAPSPAPRSSTAPPNPFRPAQAPPTSPLQTNPFRTLPQPQPRPNSQPQIPQPHHHHHPHPHPHHHHHHHPQPLNPFGPIPMPPHIQQQFAQAMAQNQQQQQQNQAPIPAQSQESNGGTPAPEDGAQGQQAGPRLPVGSGLPNLPQNTTRTIRQEGIGPNGERWTVTWNNTNLTIPIGANQQPILPRPFPHPPGFPLPAQRTPSPARGAVPDQILARIRIAMDYARQEMENVRVLLQPPGGQAAAVGALAAANPPPWRIDQIRHAVRNLIGGLDNVDRGLASLVADPLMAQNRDFVSLQQSAAELRGQAEEFNTMLDRLRENSSNQASNVQGTDPAPSAPAASSQTAPTTTQSQQGAGQTSSSGVPTELFILSSPQGPVGILFDQRGTYTTAPMVPTLPFQTFSQQFAVNRQLIAGIGQQITHNSTQFHNQLAAAQQAPNSQTAAGAQPAAQQAQNQNQDQNQAQAQGQNQNQPAQPAPEQDRMALIAGHLWLIFKLACFIYFFAGGGGWYRPIMMGIIAAVVYLAQIGIFEDQFNIVRRHFEALLPLADRPAQGANRQNANGQGQQNPAPVPDRNLTPEETARRLLQQRQDQRFGWLRETMRTTERAFAIFVASLWPGIGERMVQAQEERVRAERAAEEERQRLEEARRLEEEEKQKDAEAAANSEVKEGSAVEAGPSEGASSGKGKEKVEVAAEEAASAS